MSTDKVVTVLAPNGHRVKVKCTPNTTILQVLENVCAKQKFNAANYTLKHHNKVLDLSCIIRFSGLPNNADLEMWEVDSKRSETNITLGLQLENGQRPLGEFNPSTSLYEVLISLAPDESDASLNPVLIYTRRETYGEESLKTTTLRDLGLTGGRAIIRLIHRTPEQLKIQANVSSSLVPKPKPREQKPACKITANASTVQANDVKSDVAEIPEKPIDKIHEETIRPVDAMEVDELCPDVIESKNSNIVKDECSNSDFLEDAMLRMNNIEQEVIVIGDRNSIAFRHSDSYQDSTTLDEIPDDYYELSANEVKKILKDLRQKREQLENTPLLTEELKIAEREKQIQLIKKKYKNVVVRVQFPNRIILQGIFEPTDKLEMVLSYLKQFLNNPELKFHLFVTPPKTLIDPEETFIDAKFVPCVLLHFGFEDKTASADDEILKADITEKLTASDAASIFASKFRRSVLKMTDVDNTAPAYVSNQATRSSQPTTSSATITPSRQNTTTLPKWFKVNK